MFLPNIAGKGVLPCVTRRPNSALLFRYASNALPGDGEDSNASNHRRNLDPVVVLILGKPGGGKGTISNKILKDFPAFVHLSTGDVLRRHLREGSSIGLEAKKFIECGGLVPDKVMIDLVSTEAELIMSSDSNGYGDGRRSLLLDGFPRTIEQAIALERGTKGSKSVSESNDVKGGGAIGIDLVINLDIPTETIVDRIAKRWIHASSGRIYNYGYHSPIVKGKDDETGEDLVQREDDKPNAVRKRLSAFDEMTSPLVNYFSQKKKANGESSIIQTFSGTMSDVIYPEVKKCLDSRLSLPSQPER